MRALATSSASRELLLREVPTLKEAGLKGFEMTGWSAAFVPAKTPKDTVAKLSELLRAALADPAVRQEFSNTGGRSHGSTPDECARSSIGNRQVGRRRQDCRNSAGMNPSMKTIPIVIRAADLAAYAPANHTGTSNVRVIGPETIGATALEVLVGTIVKSHGAKPHAHPHLEQCAYMIEGTGESQARAAPKRWPPEPGPTCRPAPSIRFA